MISFKSNTLGRGLGLTALAAAAVLSVLPLTSPSADSLDRIEQAFEVAMDGTSFHFEGPVNANGVPADGTPFIIQGYIYPAGTFATNGDLSGVLADGSPEFPDLVMGKWICRGWHLQDGDAVTGPLVATTQIFDFDPNNPGLHTIVTDGIELADVNVPFCRAITGGTGRFEDLEASHSQKFVADGVNASGGFSAAFKFRVKP